MRLLIFLATCLSLVNAVAENKPRYFTITGLNESGQFLAFDSARGIEFVAEFNCGAYSMVYVTLTSKEKIKLLNIF